VTAHDWTVVDEGWGRCASDFATLSEPANCREYVALHHLLGVDSGDRLLDIACGSGLAVELAALRGATCAGIDASARLVAVARDRSPEADVRVGDMHALPWPDATFDVATSFRGIWGTTPAALDEVHRVLVPGGRVGLTVWGHLKVSPGAWALAPLRLADAPAVANQAAMVALGRPGVGEQLLAATGFIPRSKNACGTGRWIVPAWNSRANSTGTGSVVVVLQSESEPDGEVGDRDGFPQQARGG
jgi:SAM-dependent methyltransferase